MRPNDTVIFIEDETPEQRSQRLGTKRLGTKRRMRQDHRARSKVGHLDIVARVAGGRAQFAKDRQADIDKDTGQELPDSRIRRANGGHPTRTAYICPPDLVQLPRGLSATIDSIELDDYTTEAIKRYDAKVRQERANGN